MDTVWLSVMIDSSSDDIKFQDSILVLHNWTSEIQLLA